MSDADREQFAVHQNKVRKENKVQLSDDLEILRCSKPNPKHLSLTLLQKAIFDLLYGSLIASAGLSMYGAFDYLTFSESLDEA